MVRAKASNGYDAETMAIFAPVLVVTPERIARDWVLVATRDDALLGFAGLDPVDADGIAWLEDLFVDPDAQGQGIGTRLWGAVLDHAYALGASELRFDADPHAVAFYERLGATVIGATPSTLIPGRTMPLMRYRIGGKQER
jgi:GNAT superfamily N-acetyltransferase